MKLNTVPFQFPYGGQPTDVYSEKNYKRVMAEYRKFVEKIMPIVGPIYSAPSGPWRG